jgi:DNA polymerase-1
MFIADEGCKFIIADFSQLELRILAKYSRDPLLVGAFVRGEDVHATTASAIFNVPLSEVTDAQRKIAKKVNFGLVYGQGADGLAKELGISKVEAQKHIDTFFEKFPSVRGWMDVYKAKAMQLLYVENMFGRRRRLRPKAENSGKRRGQQESNVSLNDRQVINSPIQGSGGDLTSFAAVLISRELKKAGLSGRLVLTVHDELVYEVKEAEVEATEKIVRAVMTHPFENEKVMGGIPLEVGIDILPHWV